MSDQSTGCEHAADTTCPRCAVPAAAPAWDNTTSLHGDLWSAPTRVSAEEIHAHIAADKAAQQAAKADHTANAPGATKSVHPFTAMFAICVTLGIAGLTVHDMTSPSGGSIAALTRSLHRTTNDDDALSAAPTVNAIPSRRAPTPVAAPRVYSTPTTTPKVATTRQSTPGRTGLPPAPAKKPQKVYTASQVRNFLDSYGLTSKDPAKTARVLTTGQLTWTKFKADSISVAKKGYPAAASELGRGRTMDQVMDPWITRFAATLELAPAAVDWQKEPLLNAVPRGRTYPTYTEFDRAVRADNRWQYTDQAHREIAATARRVAEDWGLTGRTAVCDERTTPPGYFCDPRTGQVVPR